MTAARNFQADLSFVDRARQLLVKQLYPRLTGGRFVSLDGSTGSMWLQRNAHIDAVLQLRDGRSVTVEEKIRRNRYNDFAIETLSNVEHGKQGWISTSTADWLLYGFASPRSLDCYVVPLPKLRAWFLGVQHEYPRIESSTRSGTSLYHTHCVLVPIADVEANVGLTRYTLQEEEE